LLTGFADFFGCLLAAAGKTIDGGKETSADAMADSVGAIEEACSSILELLTKVQSTLLRTREIVAPGSDAVTVPALVDALAVKEGAEDPMATAVRAQVQTGSESVITLLLANGVECDLETITTKYPKGQDGRDVSVREIATESKRLAAQLTDILARRRAERKEARARRLAKKDPASSKRTESFA
jgi:hypothetical protein